MLFFGNFSIEALLAIGIVVLFAMGIHEFAHAYVADWWGDPTPRNMGRLTINPLVHINWIGFLMWVVIGFGVLGSVPVNPRNMRDPRWGQFWTSFAGPLSNLAQAIAYALLLRLLLPLIPDAGFVSRFIILIFQYGVIFNVLLFVFNLLPLFPIDGWFMMLAALPGRGMSYKDVPIFISQNIPGLSRFLQEPARTWNGWQQATQTLFIILLIVSLFAGQLGLGALSPFNYLIGQPVSMISSFLLGF